MTEMNDTTYTDVPNDILDNLSTFTVDELKVIIGMYRVGQAAPGYWPDLTAVLTFSGLDAVAFDTALASLLKRGKLASFLDLPMEKRGHD